MWSGSLFWMVMYSFFQATFCSSPICPLWVGDGRISGAVMCITSCVGRVTRPFWGSWGFSFGYLFSLSMSWSVKLNSTIFPDFALVSSRGPRMGMGGAVVMVSPSWSLWWVGLPRRSISFLSDL